MIAATFEFLKFFWPYLVAASIGFGGAWEVQAVRLDAANNRLVAYKNEVVQAKAEAKDAAEKQRKETDDEYAENLATLANDHDAAYQRCIAAGKCRGMRPVPSCSGNGISPPVRPDGSGTDAVPAAGEPAPEVITDCARTTLMINQLQADIAKQIRKD